MLGFMLAAHGELFALNLKDTANDTTNQLSWQQDEFLPAEQAFPFTLNKQTSDSTEVWEISWEIADGYYLYRDSIKLITNEPEADDAIKSLFNKEAIIKYDPNFEKDVAIFEHEVSVRFISPSPLTDVTLMFQGCAEAGLCYPMQSFSLSGESTEQKITASLSPDKSAEKNNTDALTGILKNASLVKIALVFFLLGMGLCLTPCVLPMMPIISGLVLGREKALSTWQAFSISSTYVLAMSLTYTLIGVLAASIGASANLQIWMQHPWVLTAFALLFVLLALSMFDLYELRLPQSLQQKLDELSRKQKGGSLVSAAIMGVLSALVVSPCVSAPLAGALVFISSTGDIALGALALFCLGIGMGAPLIALCTFGTNLLPKSGEWMNRIKRFFGVLLIAVAIWMLARFLDKSLVLGLWGALFILSAFIFGAWQNQQPLLKSLQIILLIWGILCVIGASLGNTHILQPLENLSRLSRESNQVSNKNHQDFVTIHSMEALKIELKSNESSGKLLLLDFYADWCTSCQEIEETVFANPEFSDTLKQFHLVRADLSANSVDNFKLLETLELFGPPAILFFNEDGNEMKQYRIQGNIKARDFRKIVDQLRQEQGS